VLVHWSDAQLDTDFDGKAEEAGGTVELVAVGFLIRKSKKEVVIGMDLNPKTREIRFILSIPAAMAPKVRYLVEKNA